MMAAVESQCSLIGMRSRDIQQLNLLGGAHYQAYNSY